MAVYYHYSPSLAAAIAFSFLFGISTLMHLYQIFRTRTWFWIAFLAGGIFETFGFGARAINANEDPGDMKFAVVVISNIGIILAPVLFAASVYMTLRRIILLTGHPELSLVRPQWLTKLFVLGDVTAFLVQAYGVSQLTSDDPDKVDTGRIVMVIGLWIQIVFFTFFIITALLFWRRMSRLSTKSSKATPWKKHLLVLLIASLLILVRCLYRVIEYMQGPDGSIISNETYVYVFDAVPMFIMMITFHYYHPSEVSCLLFGGKMICLFRVEHSEKRPDMELTGFMRAASGDHGEA
ncbi:Protein RTA1 [Fusarium oxysporum f. sp. cubense]|uniref:Protein RTA1 n=1 Tax=Fusarium oxysporum f. sp. cubense TaxID=61366 RepID=A0A559KXL0_FUSOC|nr:Protein RTA1 [Fusarium oxysporum f. sp. cubense]